MNSQSSDVSGLTLPIHSSSHPSKKHRGNLSEIAFCLRAAERGFAVSKPYGENDAYDWVLDNGCQLLRIQVKSTSTKACKKFVVNTHHSHANRTVAYNVSEVDFIVVHVVPEQAWFVIPIHVVAGHTSILLPTKTHAKRRSRYEQYREAWHLLDGLHSPQGQQEAAIENEAAPLFDPVEKPTRAEIGKCSGCSLCSNWRPAKPASTDR